MRRIHIYISIAFIAALSLAGCHEEYVTYSDAEYIMFADTMAIYPVQAKGAKDASGKVIDTTFVVPIVSTVVKDYDRTVGVEIIDKGSNAIEKKHYRLETNTITIKAGSNRADLLVHGYYNNIEPTDSLGFELQLVMNDALEMPLYGKSTKVVMMKSCPFNINNFGGDLENDKPCYSVLTSMFLYQYGVTGKYQRLIETYVHPTENNKIICKNWMADGYDVTMTFHPEDPMKPFVTMDSDQVMSDEGSIFGMTHGDDKILVESSPYYDSIFYPCGSYLYVYIHVYVEDLGEAVGTVGHFYNIMEWVSEEEAERLKREEGM